MVSRKYTLFSRKGHGFLENAWFSTKGSDHYHQDGLRISEGLKMPRHHYQDGLGVQIVTSLSSPS